MNCDFVGMVLISIVSVRCAFSYVFVINYRYVLLKKNSIELDLSLTQMATKLLKSKSKTLKRKIVYAIECGRVYHPMVYCDTFDM